MEVKKIYLDDRNIGVIVCLNCGKHKEVDAVRFGGKEGPFKAKCSCGYVFAFTLEKRRQYRKMVDLAGTYFKDAPNPETGEMIVQDISRTGISFETRARTAIQIDDIIQTKFVLDDLHRTVITKRVIVRRVRGQSIGAEFCDGVFDRRLAFYLMP